MPTLVLVRHGQSAWNLENRFTGWWDVDLSAAGEEEARQAGRLLADEGLLTGRGPHVPAHPGHPDAQHPPGGDGAALDPGAPALEAQRAPLRRLDRPGQGRDARPLRRRAVPAVAAQLRRAPAPDGAGRPYDVSLDPRYVPGVVPRHRVPGRRGRPHGPVLVRRHRPPPPGGQGGPGGRPRQQPAGAHQSTSTR